MGLVGVRGWSLTPSLRLRGWATEQFQPKNGKYLLFCSRAFRDRQTEAGRDCERQHVLGGAVPALSPKC